MKIALIIALVFFPDLAMSQAAEHAASGQGSADTVTKIVHIRYADAARLADLAGSGVPKIRIDADRTLKVIVVKGPERVVASVEQTIHDLDVPSVSSATLSAKDVELTVSVISGSNSAEGQPETQGSPDLAPVIRQLRAIFPYKNYQLLSSMLLRSRENSKATNSGVMKNTGNTNYSQPSSYVVGFDAVDVSQDGGKPNLHVRNFRFTTRIPFIPGAPGGAGEKDLPYAATQFQNHEITIGSDVDLREGQKVVVGKANIANSDSALFVVLTARLVE